MRLLLMPVCLMITLAAAARGAGPPDFSGTWKMNPARSNFGANPPLTSYTRVITHSDGSITIEDDQRGGLTDVYFKVRYAIGGKASNYNLNGIDMEGTAAWDKDDLITVAKDTAGIGLATRARMSLSSQGRILTVALHAQTPQGAFDVIYVFDKQ